MGARVKLHHIESGLLKTKHHGAANNKAAGFLHVCLFAGLRPCHNSIRQPEMHYSRRHTPKVTGLWRWVGAFAQKNIWFGYKYHTMKEQRSRVKGKEHDNQRRWKIFTLIALRYSVSNSDQHRSAVSYAVQPAWPKLQCPWYIYGGLRFVLDLLCIKTEETKIPICLFSKLWISIIVLTWISVKITLRCKQLNINKVNQTCFHSVLQDH